MSTREAPPAGWTKTTVGEVGRVQLGRQRSPKNHSGPHMRPYLRVANVFEDRINLDDVMEMNFTPAEYEVFKLEPGDILLNEGQSLELVGRPAMYRGEMPGACFTNSLVRFQAGPLLDPKFALYVFLGYLHTGRFQRIATNTVNIAHLGAGRFADVEFWLPPRSEQERIVAKVDELFSDLDAGIASLKRAKANLKRYRASVLKAAVEGRLTEEWRKTHPQAEDGQMLLDRILRERREKWERDQLAGFAAKRKEPPTNWQTKYEEPSATEASELPALPEGWIWVPMARLAEDAPHAIGAGPFGTIFKAKDFRPTGIPVIFLRHVRASYYSTAKPGFMARDVWEKLFRDEYTINGTELLVTKLGDPPGTACLYPSGIGPAMVTPDVIQMRVRNDVASADFLMHYLNSKIGQAFTTGKAFGTTRLRLTLPLFKDLPVPLPPRTEQQQIVTVVGERLSQVDAAAKTIDAELMRSKRLRQSILKRAFEGTLFN